MIFSFNNKIPSKHWDEILHINYTNTKYMSYLSHQLYYKKNHSTLPQLYVSPNYISTQNLWLPLAYSHLYWTKCKYHCLYELLQHTTFFQLSLTLKNYSFNLPIFILSEHIIETCLILKAIISHFSSPPLYYLWPAILDLLMKYCRFHI